MRSSWLLLCLSALAPHQLAAQSDTAKQRCLAQATAPADSILPVDVEPQLPIGFVKAKEMPNDAGGHVVVADFVVTATGRVDTTSVKITGTQDAKWISQFRHDLLHARIKPAEVGRCPVARKVSFGFNVMHLH